MQKRYRGLWRLFRPDAYGHNGGTVRRKPLENSGSVEKIDYNYCVNHPKRRTTMASKDKAGKEERKKPKLSIKEKRKAKEDKKKSSSVTNTGA